MCTSRGIRPVLLIASTHLGVDVFCALDMAIWMESGKATSHSQVKEDPWPGIELQPQLEKGG
jgi:hypothetical protein